MTQPTVSKHSRKIGPRIRLQSHQVHPTVLTIIQQISSMKQKYTQINTNKSMHSEMGPVRQKPIQSRVVFVGRIPGIFLVQ